MKGKAPGSAVITKNTNRHVELVERLAHRSERDRSGLYFAEGVRALACSVERGHSIQAITYVPQLLNHPLARRLVVRLCGDGVKTHAVSIDVFRRLSRMEEPQWVGVTLRQQWADLDAVVPANGLCWVALEAIRTPGNLGTILRTCDAVGAAGVIALGKGADPYDPSAVRASMGSIFCTTLIRATASDLSAWAGRVGAQLIATSPTAKLDYRQVEYRSPVVLVMGAERSGLSAPLLSRCGSVVRIPMVGTADSLNVAVATGVMLYEVLNQRRDSARRFHP
jgi:TrmH family RNA methyltransferase